MKREALAALAIAAALGAVRLLRHGDEAAAVFAGYILRVSADATVPQPDSSGA